MSIGLVNGTSSSTSSSLAKLMTGQKAEWARLGQEIGQQMVQSSAKALIQKGIGALAKTKIGKKVAERPARQAAVFAPGNTSGDES